MATIIRPNGMKTEIQPRNGRCFTLHELKVAIGGGHIEIVRLNARDMMVLDEDGKGKELPLNMDATMLLAIKDMEPDRDMVEVAPGILTVGLRIYDYVVGQVLICHSNQIE